MADLAYSEFITLFARWSNVFSCNKYDVGLTKEEYFIRLIDGAPVKQLYSLLFSCYGGSN